RGQIRYPQNVDFFMNIGARWDEANESFVAEKKVPAVVAGTDVRHLGDGIAAVKAVATKDRIEKIRQARFDETKKFTERLRAGREANAKKIWDNKPIEWDRVGKEIEAIADKDAIIVEEFGSQRNKCMDHINIGYGAKTQLGRTTGECLGWGLPAAIGVKLAKPNQQVWALQGDGGMLFNQTEALWPMRRHEAPIITVVSNNRSYNETRNRMWTRG